MFRVSTTRSGVTYNSELEERLASQWAGYRYEEFLDLDGDQQAEHIAAYRVTHQVEAVLAQQSKTEQRQSAKPKRKARR